MEKLVCPTCNIEIKDRSCPKCGVVIACSVKRNPFSSVSTIRIESKKGQKTVIFFLCSFLFFVLGAGIWRFYYYTPKSFIRPLDITGYYKKGENIPLAKFDNREQTIPIDVDLTKGNFLIENFYQFISQNLKLSVEGFNIVNVLNRFAEKPVYESFKKEFDVTDDDLKTYLSSGFLLLFPSENLDQWGFVIRVNDIGKDFVEERVNKFNDKLKEENKNYPYNKYSARLVKIVSTDDVKVVIDNLSSEKVIEEDKKQDLPSQNVLPEGSIEAKLKEKAPKIKTEYFLLVSTSKDFLDEMKENSEGNISNITTDLEFAKARKELPPFGQLFIFKQGTNNAWEDFVGRFVLVFPYDGLEELLNSYKSFALSFYSVDSKLKILPVGIEKK